MASASMIAPVCIKEAQLSLSGISSYLSAPPYHGDYDSNCREPLTEGLENSYQSAGDKKVDLEGDFREVNFGKFDYIIEKIGTLRFGQPAGNACGSEANRDTERLNSFACVDDELSAFLSKCPESEMDFGGSEENCRFFGDVISVENTAEEVKEEDSLAEKRLIRARLPSPRSQPYSIHDRLSRSPRSSYSAEVDYDSTAEKIFRDKEYRDKLSPCLDQLSSPIEQAISSPGCSPDRSELLTMNSTRQQEPIVERYSEEGAWPMNDKNCKESTFLGNARSNEAAAVPSIVIENSEENSFLNIFLRDDFSRPTQTFSENNANSTSTLMPQSWSDSSTSNYNAATSRPNSRCSSRAQSPGSGINLGSPLINHTVVSPVGSPQIASMHKVPPALSSSSSSSHSFCDTPSPSNYHAPVNQMIEERLCENLECLPVWKSNATLSGTIVRASETINRVDIDSNELQLLEEVLRDLGGKSEGVEEPQVVPSSSWIDNGQYGQYRYNENDLNPASSSSYVLNAFSDPQRDSQRQSSSLSYENCSQELFRESASVQQIENRRMNNGISNERFYGYSTSFECGRQLAENLLPQDVSQRDLFDDAAHPLRNELCQETYAISTSSDTTQASSVQSSGNTNSVPKAFNEFQIPEMVSSFRSRRQDRSIVPWPSLNLPSVRASERLKQGLNPKEVEKAMTHLLKRPITELARPDQDGDTMLMCLVGNPEELAKKKAYLAPLVERLGNIREALSMTNNRGEDALYLAAMNCPQMSYVTGYLAAAMLQKGIDINQKLYHTRGDTLIHSVAARGDTHGEVLAELLALKTTQGHAVYDLSKRNYDGRTALHVAVEAHDPIGRRVSSIGTVRLLLENGADLGIKETKCGDTALHMAVSLSCDPALVKALLAKATPDIVNTVDYNYNTPLHMAAAVSNNVSLEKQKEVCWLLIQAKARGNIQNRQGKTPLALVSPERKDAMKRIFYSRS